MRRITVILVLTALLLGVGVYLFSTSDKFRVMVPEYQPPGVVVHLEQGWNESQRLRFHHTPQGTGLLLVSFRLCAARR